MNRESGQSQSPEGFDYETFLKIRAGLIENGSKQSASFDKHVLTLASGVLAGVIVFLEKVAPDPVGGSLWV